MTAELPEHEPEASDVDMDDKMPMREPSLGGNASREPVVWGQATACVPELAPICDQLDSDAKRQRDLDMSLLSFKEQRPKTTHRKSPTIVLEVACHLLLHGALNIPDVGGIHVEQARALLWNAVWLQEHMNEQWRADDMGVVDGPSACEASFANEFTLAIMGPGGTGKTAVLRVVEALIIFFKGADAVQKMAPPNAAARLLRGDTLHACCKLPFGKATLTSRKGQLRGPALKQLRARWRTVVAAFLDEVSMVAANQLHQSGVRIRTAKNGRPFPFGGVAMDLCGDFLQLPPVDKSGCQKSLAIDMDEYGRSDAHDGSVDELHAEDTGDHTRAESV